MIALSKVGEPSNALAMVDNRYAFRWLDAWGDVDKVVVDFYRAADWTVTATGTSPVANSLVPGAAFLITSGANDFDGDNMQMLGSKFKCEAGKPLYFGAKATLSEATQSDFLVGLCGVDNTLTAASSAHALAVSAGGVFFSKLDAVTAGYFKTYTTGTEVNSVAAFTADTSAHWYEFYWDGYKVTALVDNAIIGCSTGSVTTEVLTPSINFRAGSAGAKTCTIHKLVAIAVRG